MGGISRNGDHAFRRRVSYILDRKRKRKKETKIKRRGADDALSPEKKNKKRRHAVEVTQNKTASVQPRQEWMTAAPLDFEGMGVPMNPKTGATPQAPTSTAATLQTPAGEEPTEPQVLNLDGPNLLWQAKKLQRTLEVAIAEERTLEDVARDRFGSVSEMERVLLAMKMASGNDVLGSASKFRRPQSDVVDYQKIRQMWKEVKLKSLPNPAVESSTRDARKTLRISYARNVY